jgi:hypothetical protein
MTPGVSRDGIRVGRYGANWWAVLLVVIAVSLGWKGILYIGGLMVTLHVVTALVIRGLDRADDRKR